MQGYAISRSDELQLVTEIATSTGIILDPVYSGKAAKGFMSSVEQEPEKWHGRRILFLHTGGATLLQKPWSAFDWHSASKTLVCF